MNIPSEDIRVIVRFVAALLLLAASYLNWLPLAFSAPVLLGLAWGSHPSDRIALSSVLAIFAGWRIALDLPHFLANWRLEGFEFEGLVAWFVISLVLIYSGIRNIRSSPASSEHPHEA